MNILLLYPKLLSGTGGVQVFNHHLSKALIDLGHQLRTVAIQDAEKKSIIPRSRKASFLAKTFQQTLLFRPDLVIAGHINLSPVCLLLKKLCKTPYFLIVYGVDVWNLSRSKQMCLEESEKIISISNFTKETLISKIWHLRENQVSLLPCSFDSERFKPLPKPAFLLERWQIKEDETVLLTVARLKQDEIYKGYDKTILAMKPILKEFPRVKYVLAGDGDDIDRVKSLIQKHELNDRVILPGFVPPEELPHYYNLCDIFVMPSSGEGFGIVFLEALACGKPVVAGCKDGSTDPLLNGKLGLLVNPESIQEIADAVIRILKRQVDPKFLDAVYLRNEVIKEFGFEKFQERLKQLLLI